MSPIEAFWFFGFICALAALIWFLSLISETINDTDSDEAGNTSEEQKTSQQFQSDAGNQLLGIQNAIDAYRKERRAQERKSSKREKVTIAVLAITALFAAGAVIAGGVSAWIFQAQLNESRNEQRAWIAPIGLQIPDNFKSFNVSNTRMGFAVQNVGKEPAQNVTPVIYAATIAVENINQPTVIENIFKEKIGIASCKQIAPDVATERSLFPQARTLFATDLNPGETAMALANLPAAPPNHIAIVVGCVAYETLGTAHYTDICGFLELYDRNGRKDWDWSSDRCVNYQGAN